MFSTVSRSAVNSTASSSSSMTSAMMATRHYGTKVTRTMFPRHYRLRAKINSENDTTTLADGSLFIRRPTAGPTTSILSSQHPSPASVSSRASPVVTSSSTSSSSSQSSTQSILPPPLRTSSRPDFAHLSETQLLEMRTLRTQDPSTWTRSALAKKFNVSEMYVKIYAPAPQSVQNARFRQQREAFAKKGWKAQEIVVQRQKRRELW